MSEKICPLCDWPMSEHPREMGGSVVRCLKPKTSRVSPTPEPSATRSASDPEPALTRDELDALESWDSESGAARCLRHRDFDRLLATARASVEESERLYEIVLDYIRVGSIEEVRSMREDQERLDWLDAQGVNEVDEYGKPLNSRRWEIWDFLDKRPTLRQAIDAERSATRSGQRPNDSTEIK